MTTEADIPTWTQLAELSSATRPFPSHGTMPAAEAHSNAANVKDTLSNLSVETNQITAAGQGPIPQADTDALKSATIKSRVMRESTAEDESAPREVKRRRRTKSKGDLTPASEKSKYSYATSWATYIDGHVVSETSRRFIVNLLAATAATQAEKPEDSSEDSDAEAWQGIDVRTGNLDIVHKTLTGMAKRSSDEGAQALGRHARTIRLGRSLWQSEPLSSTDAEHMCERFFDDGTFPPLKEVKKALDAVRKWTRHGQLLSLQERNLSLAFPSKIIMQFSTNGCTQ